MRRFMLKFLPMPFLAALLALTAMSGSMSAAQDDGPPAEGGAAITPAAEAFQPLLREYRNLAQSLEFRGGIAPEDRAVVQALRDRVHSFSQQWPGHEPAVGIELQLTSWLGEEEALEGIYRRAIEAAPRNQKFQALWGRHLLEHNRIDEALEVLRGVDQAVVPHAGVWIAEALAKQNRYDEAIQTLSDIPNQVNPDFPGLSSQVAELRSQFTPLVELWSKERTLREAEAAADDLPRVRLQTARGPIVLELFENQAPEHVANFITLIEQGFYDGTKFHRVQDELIQGGDSNTKEGATGEPGAGGPGYRIAGEFRRADARSHFAGTLAMARSSEPNSAGSQFYITRQATPEFNGQYTVFGRVLEGMDALYQMEKDDAITRAEVLRKREHEYTFSKLPEGAAVPTADEDGPTSPTPPIIAPEVEPETEPEPEPESAPESDPQSF